jgi:hypothetical protein
MHAKTKLNIYLILFAIYLPDRITQIEIDTPKRKKIPPIARNNHPINSGGCSPPLLEKVLGERIKSSPMPTCINGIKEKSSMMPPTI